MINNAPIPDVRPPNPPWLPIKVGTKNTATITYYYGDERAARIPIRDVSHRMDAKHDPNIETQTYGLFSNCCINERKAIVEEGIGTQFFCTARTRAGERGTIRVLTGFYHPTWYCEMDSGDYAIAAQSVRFVAPGFVLSDLVAYLDDYAIDASFRTWKHINDETVIRRLLLLLITAPDATADYISEIHRLEDFSLKQYGRMYLDRLSGFSWEYAGELMRDKAVI